MTISKQSRVLKQSIDCKEELRKEYGLNKDDVLFLDDAMTFATEYLFPRFKFHHKGIVYVGKAASTDSEGKDICRRVG